MEDLRNEGVLCDDRGRVLPEEAHLEAKPVWFGKKQSRSFLIRSEALRLV